MEITPLTVNRGIKPDGTGHIKLAVSPPYLETMLAEHGVRDATELPEEILRGLCDMVGVGIHLLAETIEQRFPGTVGVSFGSNAEDGALLRSGDVGFGVVRAFIPDPDSDFETRPNPQYNTVQFELQVTEPGETAAGFVTRTLVSRTYEPPCLA